MKKVETITLDAGQREQLQAARAELQAASDERAAAEARVEEVQQKLNSVEMRIEELKCSLDATKDDQVRKLVELERQFPLLQVQLRKTTAAVGLTDKPILFATQKAAGVILSLVKPIADAAAEEASEAFAPYFENLDRARRRVKETDWWQCVHAKLNFLRRVEDFHSEKVLGRLDSVLNGDLAWFWE
jgi:hypothetical protein